MQLSIKRVKIKLKQEKRDLMSYQKELDLLIKAIPEVYEQAKEVKKEISYKAGNEVVTSIDLFVESELIKRIKDTFPLDTFLSEEFYQNEHLNDRTWVIDPIDGTSNFSVELDLFVIQVALYDKGTFVLSMIYVPTTNKMLYALKGVGAFRNGVKYLVSDSKEKENLMLSMVGITTKHKDKTVYEKLIVHSMTSNTKIRILGSIGLEMSLMSEGVFDMFYSSVTNIWDIAPGILLSKEAGALVFNEQGKPYQIGDKHLFITKSEKSKAVLLGIII